MPTKGFSKYSFALGSLEDQLRENLLEQKELKEEARVLRNEILEIKEYLKDESK